MPCLGSAFEGWAIFRVCGFDDDGLVVGSADFAEVEAGAVVSGGDADGGAGLEIADGGAERVVGIDGDDEVGGGDV